MAFNPKKLGCGVLVLIALFFFMSREGQSLLSFLWTIVELILEIIGRHLDNLFGGERA
ncbi:hypothetical protein BPTFM16_00572 [Altererythrobacter insulae]|nr:hypothetical protein BPTFM16_00572 [Altererythrobacter insulae]